MLFYTAVIVVLALGNFIITKKADDRLASTWAKVLRPGLLLLATVVLVWGSDLGGQLVFKHGMGVQPPKTPSPGVVLPGQAVAPGDSAKAVQPHDDGHEH
jgi:uncharacterized membrane protein